MEQAEDGFGPCSSLDSQPTQVSMHQPWPLTHHLLCSRDIGASPSAQMLSGAERSCAASRAISPNVPLATRGAEMEERPSSLVSPPPPSSQTAELSWMGARLTFTRMFSMAPG